MRLTYKFLFEYFDENIKPIAPFLKLDTINDAYAIKLRKEGQSGYRMIVFQSSPKEIYAWMKGFLNSYNYFKGEL